MKNNKLISIVKNIKITHIVLSLFIIKSIVYFEYIVMRYISLDSQNFSIFSSILTLFLPAILFVIGYYFLKISDSKKLRIFDSIALMFGVLSLPLAGYAIGNTINVSLISIISVIIIGLLLSRGNIRSRRRIFYKCFIVLQIVVLMSDIFSRIAMIHLVFPDLSGDSLSLKAPWIASMFASPAMFILPLIFGYGYSKIKPITTRLYNLFVIATIVQFSYEVFYSLISLLMNLLDNHIEINLVVVVISSVLSMIVFHFSITAVYKKETPKLSGFL